MTLRRRVRRGGSLVALLGAATLLGGCSDTGSGTLVGAPGADESEVDSVAVSPATARLDQVGQIQPFQAAPLNAAGDTLAVEVAWSSSDVAVATISQDGEATARGPGQVDVTATAGTVTGQAVLSVAPVVEP
jgi:uncharacterized protein YjdB